MRFRLFGRVDSINVRKDKTKITNQNKSVTYY